MSIMNIINKNYKGTYEAAEEISGIRITRIKDSMLDCNCVDGDCSIND